MYLGFVLLSTDWTAFLWLPVVQIPGTEEDPALLAAVGVDGVEGQTHILVKRSLQEATEKTRWES